MELCHQLPELDQNQHVLSGLLEYWLQSSQIMDNYTKYQFLWIIINYCESLWTVGFISRLQHEIRPNSHMELFHSTHINTWWLKSRHSMPSKRPSLEVSTDLFQHWETLDVAWRFPSPMVIGCLWLRGRLLWITAYQSLSMAKYLNFTHAKGMMGKGKRNTTFETSLILRLLD